jgi:hypothetical protein
MDKSLPPDYRKQFNDELNEIRAKRNASAAGHSIFHYTTAESFHGIITTGQVWLTNAAYLNDVNELSYAVRLLRNLVDSRLQGLPEVGRRTLLESVLNKPVDSPSLTDVDRAVLSAILERTTERSYDYWYLASFSLEQNKLSQWRAYCPAGGYAIGFKASALVEKFGKNFAFQLGEVNYDPGRQAERVLTLLDSHLAFARQVRERYPEVPIETHIKNCAAFSELTLSLEMLFFKSAAFEEEREWRLLIPEFAAQDLLRFHSKANVLKPYIEIDFTIDGKLPLEMVRVGPLGEQELLTRSAELLLRINNYPIRVDRVDYRMR